MWMTIEELALYLKVSKEKIYKMAQQNQIPCSKLGGSWRFKKEKIDSWLENQQVSHDEDKKCSQAGGQ